jgi:hypothetical protein
VSVGAWGIARALLLLLPLTGRSAMAGEEAAASAPPTDAGEDTRVEVTVTTGAGPCPPLLREVVAGQLADVTTDLVWTCRERRDPEEAFRTERAETAAIRISIDVRSAAEARLLLGDARSDRFVVRRVPLPTGLDEIGREQVGQIVRFATLALRSSSDLTLSRTEARAAVASWPAPEARQPTAPRVDRTPRPPRFAVEVGPIASASLFSREIPIVGELALAGAVRQLAWGALGWIEAGYRLPAHYDAEPVGVELSAASLRVGLAVGTPEARRLSITAGAGFGVARDWFAPTSAAGSVAPAASGAFWTASTRLLVSGELRATSALTIAARLSCDIAAADVHYDLHGSDGSVRRVLTAYRVAPGVGIAVTWRL